MTHNNTVLSYLLPPACGHRTAESSPGQMKSRATLVVAVSALSKEVGTAPGWFDGAVTTNRTAGWHIDVLVAVAAFVLASALVFSGADSDGTVEAPRWMHFVSLGVVCAAMTLRRRAPVIGLIIGTVGFGVEAAIGMSLATAAVYTDNVYAATVRGPRHTPRILLVLSVLVSVITGVWVYTLASLSEGILVGAVLALILLSPATTGILVREHRDRAELERDRAAKIAQLAEVDRRATLTEERTRMARELHDTIANHFSAIAMQSSAVLTRSDMDMEAVRKVVAAIRAGSVAGLAEMRRTIEFLRATDSIEDPVQHRLSDLEELVTRMRATGLSVTLNVTGETSEIPIAVEFAAYRIIQEALTNVLKHGNDAKVRLDHRPGLLDITVDNRMPAQPSEVPGTGNGLIGMRERVVILGGDFSAGPLAGGWRVHACLPTVTPQEPK
jgi:signal transduction histidine kinase